MGGQVSVASALGLLLGTTGDRSAQRATRGYLVAAMWAVAAAFGLAVRAGMPPADLEVANAVPTLALVGSAVLAVVPWRRWPDCAALVPAVGGAVVLVLGVGAGSGQLLDYQMVIALLFAYTGITCRPRASLLACAICVAALAVTTLGAQQDNVTEIGLGIVMYGLLGGLVALIMMRLRTEQERREAVNGALIALLGTSSAQEAADLAARLGADLLGVDGAAVLLADEPGSTLFRGVAGLGPGEALVGVEVDIATETTAMGRAVATSRPLFLDDARDNPMVAQRYVDALSARTTLYLPVAGDAGVLGVIVLWWITPGHPLDHGHDSALNLLSVQMGQVLERHRHLHHLDNVARTDALTGLGNRRQFDLALAGMQPGGGVLLLDLDRFKPVNDTLGHAAGDQVLADFADRLRRCTRAGEACRVGGDEFAVVFPDNGAAAVTSALRRLTETWPTPHGVTFGHGFAEHAAGDPPRGTVTRADMALYAAKRVRGPVSR